MAEKNAMAVPRETRMLYTKGVEAVQRENFDYAVDLLTQVLTREPGFVECRKALRKAQQGRAESKGGGFFKKVLSGAGNAPSIAKAQLALHNHNPAEALNLAEHVLNADPASSSGHRIVVEAARVLELPETALLSLEVLHRNAPRDKGTAIEFAKALAENGDVVRGERVLVELVRAEPNDPELNQALKNLSASRTMKEGGYDGLADGQGSYRDILKNEKEAVQLEQENRTQRTEDMSRRLIGEYEARLKTEPGNLKLVRSLAELYTQTKQFDRAQALYEKIRATEMGKDPSLERLMAETEVRRFEHQKETLDKTAVDYEEQAARLDAEKIEFQIAECRKRVEKFPTDLAIRFEMGVLYFKAGKISEALAEFQKAQANPHKRVAAMNYLAQCFAKRKMFDLAAKKLQEALKEKVVFDEEKKDLIYNLGSVLESMGRKEEAIEQFKLIYEVDIGYRDVAAKVDAYYGGQ